jgi:hypothetical protein
MPRNNLNLPGLNLLGRNILGRILSGRILRGRIVLPLFPLSILLLCFFSMGAHAAAADAAANPYEAPARDFARRVADSFPAGARLGIEVRNRSTLSAGDVSAVRAAFLGELAERGLSVDSSAGVSADANVEASATITLSENTAGFVWVAEIRQGDRSSVMLAAVPRAATAPPAELSGITLRDALGWTGPEHVLAAAPFPASFSPTAPTALPPASLGAPSSAALGAANVLLLVDDGVEASIIDARHTIKIALPLSSSAFRDTQGALAWSGSSLAATVNDEACTLSAPLAGTQPQCRVDNGLVTSPAPTAQFGSQRADLPSACGEPRVEFLAAGAGDYTQPDSIRAYQMLDGAAAADSPALEFPGPVLSLQPTMALQSEPSSAALAVVHNLATGDDEVYEISLVCGR